MKAWPCVFILGLILRRSLMGERFKRKYYQYRHAFAWLFLNIHKLLGKLGEMSEAKMLYTEQQKGKAG